MRTPSPTARIMRIVVVAGLTSVLGVAACSDSDTTADGDGGGGSTTTDGGGGSSSTDMGGMGGMGTGGDGGAGMCVAFGEACTAGDTCCDAAGETGECFAFGMGSRCTIPCPANPADCPAGEGCNNQSPSKCKTQ